MSNRSLRTFLNLRRASLKQAKAILADALETEQAASEAEAAAALLIRQEISAASEATDDDLSVEALAAWLPHARKNQGFAAERHRMAAAATVRARAEVAAARAAQSAVEDVIRARLDAENTRAERHTKAAHDEQISSPPSATDPPAAAPWPPGA